MQIMAIIALMPFVGLMVERGVRMLDVVKRFGDNLRLAREAAGLTQIGLAKRLGLKNNSTVAIWESRDRAPRPRTVARLAGSLGCPVSVLMDDVPSGYDELRTEDRVSATSDDDEA